MMCRTLTSLLQTHKATSEMTTSETIKTSEKKYQTSGCACGPKNCETKRPSAQAPDPKSLRRTQTRQELCHLLRYTDEMRETSKASETKHEASGCACEPHELRAPRTANPRDQATESRTKNPSTTGRSCAHASPTRCACHALPTLHRTQRHDDNDRDENDDERDDEERDEQGERDEARGERVGARAPRPASPRDQETKRPRTHPKSANALRAQKRCAAHSGTRAR